MKTIVIILAAGNGSRFGGDTPKQYSIIDGDTLLNQTIKKFIDIEDVDAIKIAISQSHIDLYKSTVISHPKILPYCIGGETRKDSSYLALKSIEDLAPSKVLIHDAARPYIEKQIVLNILDKLPEFDAVDLGVPVTDTIKMRCLDGDIATYPNGSGITRHHERGDVINKILGLIRRKLLAMTIQKDQQNSFASFKMGNGITCLNRSDLYATQTPQGFVYTKILEAHEKSGGIIATDDISLMLNKGYNVCCIDGAPSNIKITYSDDKRSNMRIGTGFDVHKFDDIEGEYNIMLCGVSVPYNRRILAHSDGDVALHALTDAILGAMSAGDIGDHFPPSDPKWKGCDSSFFLKHVCDMLKNKGGSLGNVDLTIICQEPKVSPHKEDMRKKLAEILGVDRSVVSVKATTTEQLGFTGRKEGIAVQASCLIYMSS